MLKTITLAATALLVSVSAHASIITGAGNESCNGGPCYVQNVHPAWQPATGGAIWVAPKPANEPWPNSGSWTYEQTFVLDAPQWFRLNVWADDTADNPSINGILTAYLNGGAKNFVPDICAKGNVGCEPGEQGIVTFWGQTGANTLQVEVYPRGPNTANNPTGILIQDVSQVPVPLGLPMMALAFGGLYLMRRKGS